MKKIVLTAIAVLAMSVGFAQEGSAVRVPSGYQGFISQGNSFRMAHDWKSSICVSTTHGFYFNGNTYVGIGISLEGNSDMFVLPIYTALKYNFSYSNKITPTIQLRLGSYTGNGTGAYGDLAFGLRFGSSRDFAINVMAAASLFSNYTEDYYDYYLSDEPEIKKINPSSIGIRIGIEW